jgi:hypothetical protein
MQYKPHRKTKKKTTGKKPYVNSKPIAIAILKEKFYEVRAVLAKRITKAGAEYLVRWEGYPPSDNMWIHELPSFFEKEWGGASTHHGGVHQGLHELLRACLKEASQACLQEAPQDINTSNGSDAFNTLVDISCGMLENLNRD